MQRGARTFVEYVQDRGATLYDDVSLALPDGENTIVGTANTQAALSGPMDTFSQGAVQNEALGKALTPGAMQSLLEALQTSQGQLTWGQLAYFRTRIGERLTGAQAISDASRAEWERLYGAISEDMRTAASNAGPDASRAFSRATNFWRAGRERVDSTINDILNGEPGRLLQNLISGGRVSAEQVYTLRRSLPSDVWGDVASATLHWMGRAKPSAGPELEPGFSAATFITNWRSIQPDARAALFRGTRYRGMTDALDTVADVVSHVAESGRMANPSGTAQATMYQSILTGGSWWLMPIISPVSGSAAVAGSLLAPYAASKLLTNPKFVNWLARGTSIPASDIAGMAAHLGRLVGALEGEDPDVKDAAQEYVRALLGQQ